MEFSEYQQRAAVTDKHPGSDEVSREIPLLGLAGEVGTLLAQYKKFLRDGDAHQLFKAKVAEELGDTLWYVANVATKFGIDLEEIAIGNLAKVADRWAKTEDGIRFFDSSFPTNERLPRWFDARFTEELVDGKRRVYVFRDANQIGDFLTDNSHVPDGYRYHDAFHFAYACMLGWSPVTRRNLKIKRKSVPEIDEVEDGARAIIYEEMISAIVFEQARMHNYYEGVTALDASLLESIKLLTANLEVKVRTRAEWERAILEGFRIWRDLTNIGPGVVRYDLEQRSMTYTREA